GRHPQCVRWSGWVVPSQDAAGSLEGMETAPVPSPDAADRARRAPSPRGAAARSGRTRCPPPVGAQTPAAVLVLDRSSVGQDRAKTTAAVQPCLALGRAAGRSPYSAAGAAHP